MHVVCVIATVVPGGGEAFRAAAARNRAETRKEPGNVRFDVLRTVSPTEPGETEGFLLWEVYRTPEDFTRHQQTPHYLHFREEVVALMAEPRRGLHYTPIDSDPWE